ncbi:RNA-guided endonuclease InsQ/TnpB family protein [Pantoea eucrina]|uniref:RNA-guided endonuclease InsQ/TnpB family protein n=1 Tax=Pantoea eucrina TaxID=472693 RepID=UPI002453503B|nr:RNA-guided endonuclease TnpB family protein [Pantoea eucrina]
MHKFSTAIVNANAAIFVGDVSTSKLIKTKMAKSVLDAGWSMLKTQLEYKAIARSAVFQVVNESYSTQACSCCGALSPNSPKGRAGLRIRVWTCSECGTLHDRDVNASKNILAAGHRRLAVGIPAL